MKQKFIALLLLILPFAVGSKDRPISLTEEEKEEFRDRVIQKIEEFEIQLGYIADKRNNDRTVAAAKKSALELFIGKGERYRYTDPDSGIEYWHRPVQMETSSKTTGRKRRQSVRSYLDALRNLKYDQVEISSADAVIVDNIFQVGEGQYEAIAYIRQKFIGYKDGRPVCVDYTDKKVKIDIKAIELPEIGGVVWPVYLGDIEVHEIRN